MISQTIRNLSLAGCVLALAGCGGGGGGGGGGVNFMPKPPVAPTPTPAAPPIVGAATTSQDFAGYGGTVTYSPDEAPLTLSTSPDSQLKIRYDAAAGAYEIQLPDSQSWQFAGLCGVRASAGVEFQGEPPLGERSEQT